MIFSNKQRTYHRQGDFRLFFSKFHKKGLSYEIEYVKIYER